MKALRAMTLTQLDTLRWALNEAVLANNELAEEGDLSTNDRKQWRASEKLLTDVETEIKRRNVQALHPTGCLCAACELRRSDSNAVSTGRSTHGRTSP